MPRLRKKGPEISRFLTVRNRLFLGTVGMLLPLLCAFVVSISAFNSLLDHVDDLVYETSQELLPAVALQSDVQRAITALRDKQTVTEYLDLDQLIVQIDSRFTFLAGVEKGHVEEDDAVERAELTWELSRDALKNLPRLKDQQNEEELELLYAAMLDIQQELEVLVYVASQELEAVHEQATLTRDHAGIQIGLTLLLALVMASLFGHVLAQSILRPLQALREGAEHFGRGDFKFRLELTSRDELGKVAYAFNRMAVRLDRSLRSLRRLSTRDYLTNLLNAREFYRVLDGEMERAQRYSESFSLLIIDADHFKQINDTYGHQSGDKVLRELAKNLLSEVRSIDVTARVGGEEFAVLLPNTVGEAALSIAERIRSSAAAKSIVLGGDENKEVRVTVSIGLASYPRSAQSARELFHQADMALYNAKRGGRNRVSIA